MATIIYMRTGHAYRVDPALTLAQVNSALDATTNRFLEVPLDPAGAAVTAGTPGVGENVQHLFITPDSVSHFIVVA